MSFSPFNAFRTPSLGGARSVLGNMFTKSPVPSWNVQSLPLGAMRGGALNALGPMHGGTPLPSPMSSVPMTGGPTPFGAPTQPKPVPMTPPPAFNPQRPQGPTSY